MQKRKLVRYLLMPVGIISVLVLSLVGLFSYMPDTSVPFPYIPPSGGNAGDYLQTTPEALSVLLMGGYNNVPSALVYKEESFIFKNIEIEEWMLEWKLGKEKTYLYHSNVMFFPKDPSGLKKLKVGDKVDIIGVCVGISEEWPSMTVMLNCQFLPAGLVPLPLPGGPAPITGGY